MENSATKLAETTGTLEKNLRKSAIVRIGMGALALNMPTITLLWQEAKFSMFQTMLLQAIFSLCMAAAQMPTGYIADRLGRKLSMILGGAGLMVGDLVYAQGNSFGDFLWAEVLMAVGLAFMSGADEALLYDTLAALGRKDEFTKRWGAYSGWAFICAAIATTMGGLAGAYSIRLPFYMTAVAAGCLMLISCSLVEPTRETPTSNNWRAIWRDVKEVFRLCLGNSELRRLTLFAAFLMGINNATLWMYQPYLQMNGVAVGLWGAIFAGFNLVAAWSSQRANLVERIFGAQALTKLPLFLTTASYLLLGSLAGYWSIGFALLQQAVRGFFPVLVSRHVNDRVDEKLRASIASVRSMGERLVYALLILPLGFLADAQGINWALNLGGLATLLCGMLALWALSSKRG
jgi:MFS family permease